MKESIFECKKYLNEYLAPNPLIAFKRYAQLKEAVEIRLDIFIDSVLDRKILIDKDPNLRYFQEGKMPYKNMLFVFSSISNLIAAKEEELEGRTNEFNSMNFILLSLIFNDGYSRYYELHQFILAKNSELPEVPLYHGCLTLVCKYKEEPVLTYLRDPRKPIHADPSITEKFHERGPEQLHEDLSRHISKAFFVCVAAINYMNEKIVRYEIDGTPSIISNSSNVEVTGDIVKKLILRPEAHIKKWELAYTRQSPRRHVVRGFFRNYKSGKKIWIPSRWRGDASKGTVTNIVYPADMTDADKLLLSKNMV